MRGAALSRQVPPPDAVADEDGAVGARGVVTVAAGPLAGGAGGGGGGEAEDGEDLGELHFCWWSWGVEGNGVVESFVLEFPC